MTTPTFTDRLLATEYAAHYNPQTTRRTAFGWWTHDPRFPSRYDANQFMDVRVDADRVDDFFATLDQCYGATDLRFRKLTFHDPATAAHLLPALARDGWTIHEDLAGVMSGPAPRPVNPRVEVRSVPFDHPDRAAIYRTPDGGGDESFRRTLANDDRLGGEAIVAYLDGRPVGKTGYYVHDCIARFRDIDTIEPARKRGVATTMIHWVREQPAVRAADALCLHVGADGPTPLYRQLGFVPLCVYWSALRLETPASTQASA